MNGLIDCVHCHYLVERKPIVGQLPFLPLCVNLTDSAGTLGLAAEIPATIAHHGKGEMEW